MPQETTPNMAESLAKLLPAPAIVKSVQPYDADQLHFIAVPSNFKLEKVDNEQLLPFPRRTSGAANLSTAESFIAYVNRHNKGAGTVAWCQFDPQTYTLGFKAVFDDHSPMNPGWRKHSATYTPAMSAEWKVWAKADTESMAQVDFAAFIERNADDVTPTVAAGSADKFPTSLEMLSMATSFEANGEKRVKSIVRLQGGGMNLTYVDDNDEATLTQMKAFEKFQIGIPVFFDGPGYRIQARLRYRQNQGVKFWYELIRPDRAHEDAARELIEKVRTGIGDVPLMLGTFS